MLKKIIRKPSLVPIAAAAVVCGLSVYVVGETLSFLFRDVDPKGKYKDPEDTPSPQDTAPEIITETE